MHFFGPCGEYPPCGMFSLAHFITLIICLVLIVYFCRLSRGLKEKQIKQIICIIGIITSLLEIGKIVYNFYYGYKGLDQWLPLAFCSIFIYSTLIYGFCRGKLANLAKSFLVGAGIICGLSFLIFPTTSLMSYPIFHFLPVYSMLFHSLMVYVGITIYQNKQFNFDKKSYIDYVGYCAVFLILALLVNKIFNCNMMFLKEPYNIPLPFLKTISEQTHLLYIFIIMTVYLTIPYGLMTIYNKIFNIKKESICVNI